MKEADVVWAGERHYGQLRGDEEEGFAKSHFGKRT